MANRAGASVLLGALLFTACAFSFQRPTLRVAEVELASVGVVGGTVVVHVDIANPNGYALEGRDFRYRLAFARGADGDDWVTLAEGRHAGAITVPARDSARVELEVPFDLAPLGGALGRLLRRGSLDYRFTGELQVTNPRRALVPFDLTGNFRP